MGLENPLHLAILFVIILLLFGARRLPELGRSLGEGMRGFKDSIGGGDHHAEERATIPPAQQAPGAPAPPAEPASSPPPADAPAAQTPPAQPAATEPTVRASEPH